MHDLCLMAAQAWAQTHGGATYAPVDFGVKVAQAYLAAQATLHHAGDERATAAALAALSVSDETLQWLAQFAALARRLPARCSQSGSLDVAGAAE